MEVWKCQNCGKELSEKDVMESDVFEHESGNVTIICEECFAKGKRAEKFIDPGME